MKKAVLGIYALLVFFALQSCNKAATTAEAGETTTLEVLNDNKDFGEINQGDKVTHTFKVKNTGSTPLLLQDVKVSCGCTSKSFTETPIAPQAEGEVVVTFDSKGKSGQNNKYVTLTANTNPSKTKLSFSAFVKTNNQESPLKK